MRVFAYKKLKAILDLETIVCLMRTLLYGEIEIHATQCHPPISGIPDLGWPILGIPDLGWPIPGILNLVLAHPKKLLRK